MNASHLFSRGVTGAAFVQAHTLDAEYAGERVIRTTFWLKDHEPPVKGYTIHRKNAEAAAERFLSPPEVETTGTDGVVRWTRPAPSEDSLAAAAQMLEPGDAFGL